MTDKIHELMLANLLEVFGEADFERRAEVIDRVYTEDVAFADPDEVVVGREALNAKAQKLSEEAPQFTFSPAGPVHAHHDMGYLAWNLGPVGEPPVVQGADICLIRDGLIANVYTIITNQ